MAQNEEKPQKPIRGSLDPFKQTMDPLLEHATTGDGFETLRESAKEIIALRLQYVYRTDLVQINEQCFNILKEYIIDGHIYSFAKCTLKYYINRNEHNDNVYLNIKAASCKSRKKYKSARHALKDCLLCGKHYFGRVEKIYKNRPPLVTEHIYSAKNAIIIVSHYIFAMQVGFIPNKISVDLYNKIKNRYENISDLYELNEDGNKYKVRTKTSYKNLPIEIATELFCACIK